MLVVCLHSLLLLLLLHGPFVWAASPAGRCAAEPCRKLLRLPAAVPVAAVGSPVTAAV
jgi:hypothetical protein